MMQCHMDADDRADEVDDADDDDHMTDMIAVTMARMAERTRRLMTDFSPRTEPKPEACHASAPLGAVGRATQVGPPPGQWRRRAPWVLSSAVHGFPKLPCEFCS